MVDDRNEQMEWKDTDHSKSEFNITITFDASLWGQRAIKGTRRNGGQRGAAATHKPPGAPGCNVSPSNICQELDWSVNPPATRQLDSCYIYQQSERNSAEGVNPLNEESMDVVSGVKHTDSGLIPPRVHEQDSGQRELHSQGPTAHTGC